MTSSRRLSLVAIAVVAVAAFELIGWAFVGLGVKNLGYDFEAYYQGASRLLNGAPLYDLKVNVAGAFAIFLYPPPFGLAFVPFALLPHDISLWQWESLAVGSLVTGIAILPVSRRVRWIVLLLSVISWPVLYSILLGQVGPALFLLFAVGWRWRDKPVVVGLSIAIGALIKVQPIILLAWAGATGRWRAVAVALGTFAVAGLVATVVFGPGVWSDYLALLGRVNSSVTTPNGFSLGAILYQRGVAEDVARAIQLAATVAAAGVAVFAIVTASGEVSYVTTVVASQMISPVVWDHYAIVLIIPMAWLMDRGQWWAIGLMAITAIPSILFLPTAVYPALFWIGLLAPMVVEARERRKRDVAATTAASR